MFLNVPFVISSPASLDAHAVQKQQYINASSFIVLMEWNWTIYGQNTLITFFKYKTTKMNVSNTIYSTEGVNKYELYCKQCVNDAKQHIINTSVLTQPKNREMWEDSAVDGIYEHQNGLVASTTWVGRRRAYWKIYFMYNKLSFSYKF